MGKVKSLRVLVKSKVCRPCKVQVVSMVAVILEYHKTAKLDQDMILPFLSHVLPFLLVLCAAGCAVDRPANVRVAWSNLHEAIAGLVELPLANEDGAPACIEWFVPEDFDDEDERAISHVMDSRGYFSLHDDPQLVGTLAHGNVRLILAKPQALDVYLGSFGARELRIQLWQKGIPFGITAGNSSNHYIPYKLVDKALDLGWKGLWSWIVSPM